MGSAGIGNKANLVPEIPACKRRRMSVSVCVCVMWEWIWKREVTLKAVALHYKPFSLETVETWNLLLLSCWNLTLLLFISIPLIRNPELNSLHAYCTLPLAGLLRLSLVNSGVNHLICWTGVRETLEQLIHSLARCTSALQWLGQRTLAP